MADWFRNPTFDAAAKMERDRRRLAEEAYTCKYRKELIFFNDTARCVSKRTFDRCVYCGLKGA